MLSPCLRAEGRAGFLGRGERVEAFVGPVLQDRLEGRHDQRRLELLDVVDARLLEARVVGAGVQVDLAVVIARADHLVEVDPAVEEAPCHVAHHRAQEVVGGHLVRAGLAFRRPLDRGEISVAAEFEIAELEGAVAGDASGIARGDVLKNAVVSMMCSGRMRS